MSRRSGAVTLRSDLRRPQMYLLLVAAIAALPRLMFRFSGEDPIKGHPFYHEKITRDGAGEPDTPPDGEDDRSVANGLAWPADNVDTYLYNPLWNASGGISRFKSALFAHDDLVKVHFDDLASTAQINRMCGRYLGGTVAGVLWAMDRDDVAAARHVVGVGLHALQDFYDVRRRPRRRRGAPGRHRGDPGLRRDHEPGVRAARRPAPGCDPDVARRRSPTPPTPPTPPSGCRWTMSTSSSRGGIVTG